MSAAFLKRLILTAAAAADCRLPSALGRLGCRATGVPKAAVQPIVSPENSLFPETAGNQSVPSATALRCDGQTTLLSPEQGCHPHAENAKRSGLRNRSAGGDVVGVKRHRAIEGENVPFQADASC